MEHYRRNIDELNKMQSYHEDKDSPSVRHLRNLVLAGNVLVLTRLLYYFKTLRRRVLVLPFNHWTLKHLLTWIAKSIKLVFQYKYLEYFPIDITLSTGWFPFRAWFPLCQYIRQRLLHEFIVKSIVLLNLKCCVWCRSHKRLGNANISSCHSTLGLTNKRISRC